MSSSASQEKPKGKTPKPLQFKLDKHKIDLKEEQIFLDELNNETPIDPRKPILEAKNLKKVYQSGGGDLVILENLSLELKPGRSLAILGASGSGKSTLLHLLGGLDKPSGGQVLSRGRDIARLSEPILARWRAREVGFVFQYHYLLPEFEALENVAMPALLAGFSPKEAQDLAWPLLERVGLAQRRDHRPGALSGGERQRVALARALVLSPKILLADEPTGNLDAQNANLVNDLIGELVEEKKMSAVVVTHNIELARKMGDRRELAKGRLWPGQER
ncbi:MAG: ABC transporter ATP-binding protein [Deltaproteobacteria bacterium]|jgi:lipoprotein-releasing system ATP-binding protein|nr:ABC transporter ATP-binding protein [Deltaproteobacteria bacterium]